ncbi:MAG TPA: MFS transporter [Gemmataceae bacterium]|jgi:ACS family hexuronate transporter-like MFS transporter|nr:MFS transporter [Gemmataceae bacterium]
MGTAARSFWGKWGLCLLLFLATTLNYLDRQTLSILAPTLQDEMHFDNEALGWLFSGFYYTYTFAHFAVGLLLDRSHLRWAFALAVLAWSTVSAMTGLAGGFLGLLACRLLLGVTESPNWPAALRIISRALPPEERALGNGIFTSGTSVGALIAPGLILGLAGFYGWRWAFVIVGMMGLVWLAGWLAFTGRAELSDVWTDPAAGRDDANRRPLAAVAGLLRTRRFWTVWVVAVLINPCLYFNLNWLPTYLKQERGLTTTQELGWVLTAIFIGLDLGYLTCGAAVLGLTKTGWPVRGARRAVFLAATALVALSAVVSFLASTTEVVTALVLINFGMGLWIASYLTMAQEVSRTQVSTAAGLLGGSGSLVGALAMWAVGKVTQQTASFSLPMAAVAAAAVIAAVAGWFVSPENSAEPAA